MVVKRLVSAAALLSALLVGSVQSFSTLVPLQRTIRGSSPLRVTTRDSTTTTTTSQVANELLGLLIDHAKTKGVATEDTRIEKLMKTLIEAKVDFEPSECLFGQPLFAVAYQYGPKPFWVKYSQWVPSGKDLNIQGQQFFATDDGPEDQKNLRFINYGEFFGNAVTIQVEGVGYLKSTGTPVQQDDNDDDEASSSGPGGFLASLFGGKKQDDDTTTTTKTTTSSSSTTAVTCPVDYNVRVTGGCIRVFDNPINLDIAGPGITRVLYADPNFRIFVTPNDSQYEGEGNTVAQVRVDLLQPGFDGVQP